jgi:lipopolysaccharide/colanic/teichoic acid biosynthesis glycosyltransferase
MLVLAAPIMVIASIIIKVSSAGPVLYKQHRVGKHGRIFTLYKFRTMVNHAEMVWGLQPATPDDGRVTSIGRILRRTRLDELPQLINVLKGDMSLVGPRPENLYRVSVHAPLRGARLLVRPGITGLAQIRSYYDLKPEHKVKYDYLYIQKRSFLLNVYVLLKTVPVVLLSKGW